MHHLCMYQDQASWINASYNVHHLHVYQDEGYMYLGHMHPTPRIAASYTHAPYIHTCMLQDQGPGSCICASHMHHSQGSRVVDQTPRIALFVRSFVRNKICRIIHTCIRIKDHRCMHHTYIHQDQYHRSMHHTYLHQDQGSQMYASYVHAS